MQKITPMLWFDGTAQEAAEFYVSLFKDSKTKSASRYDKASADVAGRKAGDVMLVPFELEGQEFLALNGGPMFQFTEAVSFVINVDDQEELDTLWNALTADGGEESMCGWLKDKFGVSWQVTPRNIGELLSDPERGERATAALLQMRKIDIEKLKNA